MKVLLVLVIFVIGSGCSRSRDYDQAIESRGSRGAYSPAAPQIDPVTGKPVPRATSYVRFNLQDDVAFKKVVDELVRPQIDPQFVGAVNSQTGVVMEAWVALNKANGAVIPAESRVVLQVWDQYVNTKDSSGGDVPPVTLVLTGSTGAYNGSVVNMTYKDCAGTVEIAAQYSAQGSVFKGNVYFTNTATSDCKPLPAGVSANVKQFLGSFEVPACGFMTCQ